MIGLLCRHLHSHYSSFEVASKGIRFMVLNLTVLDWSWPQKFIKLDGVNSSCTLFILSGLRADPIVNIVTQRAAHLLSLEKYMRGETLILWKTNGKNKNITAGSFKKRSKQPFQTMMIHPFLQTYRQKYVAVTLIKVSISFLRELYQLHFLFHSEKKVSINCLQTTLQFMLHNLIISSWSRTLFLPF